MTGRQPSRIARMARSAGRRRKDSTRRAAVPATADSNARQSGGPSSTSGAGSPGNMSSLPPSPLTMEWSKFLKTSPSLEEAAKYLARASLKYLARDFPKRGLKMERIIVNPATQVNTNFDQHMVMKDLVNFEHWSEFHTEVQNIDQGCVDGMYAMIERDVDSFDKNVKHSISKAQDTVRAENKNKDKRIDPLNEIGIDWICRNVLDALTNLAPYIIKGLPSLKVIPKKPLQLGPRSYIIPDYCLQVQDANSDGTRTAIELKPPSRGFLEGEILGSERLHSQFQRVFKNPKFRKSGAEKQLEKSWFHYMLAQVMLQAMLTETGCAAIYTHNKLVCFKVIPEMSSRGTVKQLRVLVSDVIRVDGKSGNTLHGIIAFLGVREESSSNQHNLKSAVAMIENETQRMRNKASESGTQSKEPKKERANEGRRGTASAAPNVKKTVDFESSPCVSDTDEDYGEESPELRRQKLISKLMLMDYDEKIGTGGSGIVGMIQHGGRELALKVWSGESEAGKNSLLQEIRVYEKLNEKFPEVMDSAIPRLVATRTYTQLVLVTEFVGKAVTMGKNNGRYEVEVGGELVPENERKELLGAGLRSLQALHNTGLAHRDIKPANLRAAKVLQRGGAAEWKVWIADLGTATWYYEEEFFEMDRFLMQCSLDPREDTSDGEDEDY